MQTVQLAKVALRAGAGNLVNGLLRAVVSHQNAGTLPVPVLEGDNRSRARALATIHSHPVWMVRLWLTQFGEEEAVRLMECNNQRPTFSLRANSAKGVSRQDLIAEFDKLELLADQEERETEHLVASVINNQMKKLYSKVEHFEELEMLLEKEHLEVEQARQMVYADRLRYAEALTASEKFPFWNPARS